MQSMPSNYKSNVHYPPFFVHSMENELVIHSLGISGKSEDSSSPFCFFGNVLE
jgi:hypothetical protein